MNLSMSCKHCFCLFISFLYKLSCKDSGKQLLKLATTITLLSSSQPMSLVTFLHDNLLY